MAIHNTKYILTTTAGKRGLLDLRLKAGSFKLDEQQATVTGSDQVDYIYASFGMNVDYSVNNAGVDRLYLDGALNDYTTTVAAGVLTLTRTEAGKSSSYKINIADDVVVFSNGYATAAALAAATAAAGSQTLALNVGENSLTAPNLSQVESTSRVTMQSGGTLTATAQMAKLIVSGSAGVDMVYVKPGARADLSGLGGSTDKIYFTGNWADYSKTVVGSTIKFSRTINGYGEEVIVAAGAGTLNDRLVFRDGNVLSGSAVVTLKTTPSATLLGAGGVSGDAAEKTPLASLASATIVSISHDSGLADMITHNDVQTISGNYTGYLEPGDKIQVKVNGAWLDAAVTPSNLTAGVFSVSGARLASGLNHLEVRTLSAAGDGVVGVGKDVTYNIAAPAVDLTIPTPEDAIVNATESGVHVVFPLVGLKVGDVLQLVVGGGAVGSPLPLTSSHLASSTITLNVPKASLIEGDNTVRVVVRDAAGHMDESNPLLVKLDTQIATPNLSMAPTRADGGAWTSAGSNDEYINATESQVLVSIQGDAVDSTKALRFGDSIQLKKDGIALGSAHSVTAEEAAVNRVFLSVAAADLGVGDATYQLTATVSDSAGNSSSTASSLAITVDRVAPKPVLSISSVTGSGEAIVADATLTDAESSVWLKVEGSTSVAGGAFKRGDVIVLQSNADAGIGELINASTGIAYQGTVSADGAAVYILVNKSDLHGGLNQLSAKATDLAGNSDVSSQLDVTVQNALTLTNSDMTSHLVNQLEVNSQVVLVASAELGAAVAGKFIRFVNTANSGTKQGFDSESTAHTQSIDVSDKRFVSIVGNQIFIKPPFDFDLSNNYSIEVDQGAFTSTGGLGSAAVTTADGLSFSTISVGGGLAGAVQGQYMDDLTGALTIGKKWLSIEGMGSVAGAATIDLSAADYALVFKDNTAAGGLPRVSDGVGVGSSSFQVNLTQFGAGDLIYADDAFNDKTQLNDKALADVRDNGGGTYTVQFNPDASTGSDAGVINILSGASSVEGVRSQLTLDNSRLSTIVNAISRVDASGAASTDFALSAHESLNVKVSSTAYVLGDKVQLSFLNRDGIETNLGAEHLVIADDVAKGYAILTIADPAGLGLLEREDGLDNAIYAKVINTRGAVSHSPVLNDMGGVVYDSRIPAPTLNIAAGEDSALSPAESGIHLVVPAASIQLGDLLELKLGSTTLSSLTHTVTELDLVAGYTFTVLKSLLVSGSNTLTVVATDTAGNVGSGTSVLVTVEETSNHAPTVSTPLSLNVNEGDASQSLNLLANASDVDAGETATLSVQNLTYTENGTATGEGGTALPTGLTLSGDQLTLDPANAAFDSLALGQSRTMVASYQVKDVNNATVNQTATFVVAGRNDAPSVSAALTLNANEGGASQSLNLLTNASDVDAGETATLSFQNLTYTVDGAATGSSGTALPTGLTLSGNQLTLDSANVAFDSLALGQNQTIVASYQIKDVNNAAVSQTATFVVAGQNDAPTVSAALTVNVNEGVAIQELNLLTNASDVDAGETATLSIQNLTFTVDGSATGSGGTALPSGLAYSGTQLTLDPAHASFDNLNGSQRRTIVATYQIKDANNAIVNQTATIIINGQNDAPTVSAALTGNTTENNSTSPVNYTLNLLNNASDVDAGEAATLSIQNLTYTVDGTATASGGTSLPGGVTLSGSTLTVDRTNAAWNNLAANETRVLVVSYQVKDINNATVNQTATITVTGVNDGLTGAPSISGTLTEGQTMTANNGTLTDPDGTGSMKYQWHRVTVDGSGAVVTDESISGATSSTYVLGASDVDKKIYVSITANDGNGTTTGTNETKDSVLSAAWVTNFLNPADVSPTAAVQRTTTSSTAVSTWLGGKSIFTGVQAPIDTDITTVKMVFSGTGFTDPTADTLVLNADLSMGSDQTGTGISLAGLSGINYKYVAATKTLLLTHGDVVPSASNIVTPFSSAEVAAISNAVKLKLSAANTYKTDIFFGDAGLYHNEAFSLTSSATHTVI